MHPRQILDRYGIAPKQSLGQNFLFDEGLLARIVEAAELSPDAVLEIGPGLGALTRQLARAAGRVVAVELDDRLLPILRYELEPFANVEIVHDDILTFDVGAHFDGPFVVVANVPYYITGAILRRLLEGRPRPKRMVMTVQREVADRLTAKPPRMSLLAVSVQYYGSVRLVGAVKAGAFWPRPEVDSAVICIDVERRESTDGTDFTDEDSLQSVLSVKSVDSSSASDESFFRVVRAGFGEKRKQLKNNLRRLGLSDEAISVALESAGIDGRRRAETLGVGEWEQLVASLPHIPD
ncbi:MAG TPA: 16S rRNA (adenine(1518)-N(6)/adenine(1519)-N(6))-dimethyltransferase RsmA [Promineifilum sp.]|nr:16S rRNA (adenine(1518)-N(6)/adenine(1519)-N(6))-dimethyltransferase RsmA [Promineifilum sp.]